MMMLEVCADLCLPFSMSIIVDYGILENGLETIKDSGIAYWIMKTLYGESGTTQIKIIITFGSHDELLSMNGEYAKLYSNRFAGIET